MHDITKLVQNYYANKEVQYNPIPWFEYLRAYWDTLIQEAVIKQYLAQSTELHAKWSHVDLFLGKTFKQSFSENWEKELLLQFNNLNALLSVVEARLQPFTQVHLEKLRQFIICLRDVLLRFHEYATNHNDPITSLSENFLHALLIPGGHCFTFNEAFKKNIFSPHGTSNSLHRVRRYQDIYYFELNARTKPSIESIVKEFVRLLDPTQEVFPVKTLAIFLSLNENTFQTQVLQLSLRVPGVTLDTLIFAHDALQVLVPNSDQETVREVVKTARELAKNPPDADEYSFARLVKQLITIYPYTCRCEAPCSGKCKHRHTEKYKNKYSDLIQKMIIKKSPLLDIHIALTFLDALNYQPVFHRFYEWFDKSIQYMTALGEYIREYGLSQTSGRVFSSRQIQTQLAEAYDRINSHQLHLLALSAHVFLATDATGSNFIVDPVTGKLTFIDFEDCLIHAPIIERDTADDDCKHFPAINTILTNFKQFQLTPYSDTLIMALQHFSPIELFIRSFTAALQLEKHYLSFLSLFDLSDSEFQNLSLPIKLSETVTNKSFHICELLLKTIKRSRSGIVLPQAVLAVALPRTAEMSAFAYEKTGHQCSKWRHKFINRGRSYEDYFKKMVFNDDDDNVEVAIDSLLTKDFFFLKEITRKIFNWIDYKNLSDPDFKKLSEFIQQYLLVEGILSQKDVDSFLQRKPLSIHSSTPSSSDESSTTTPRSGTNTPLRLSSERRPSTDKSVGSDKRRNVLRSDTTSPTNSDEIAASSSTAANTPRTASGFFKRAAKGLALSANTPLNRPKSLTKRSQSLNALPINDGTEPLPRGASTSSLRFN